MSEVHIPATGWYQGLTTVPDNELIWVPIAYWIVDTDNHQISGTVTPFEFDEQVLPTTHYVTANMVKFIDEDSLADHQGRLFMSGAERQIVEQWIERLWIKEQKK